MFARNQQLPTSFEAYFQRLRLYHVLFMISPMIYVLVAAQIKQEIMGPQGGFVDFAPAEYGILSLVFLLASIAVAAAVLFLVPRGSPIPKLVEQSDSLLALGSALFQRQLLRVTLAAALAIFGLFLFLVNGILMHLVAFALLTLLLLLFLFPRWASWEEARKAFLTIHPF